MSSDSASWFVTIEGQLPSGPFTAQQIIDACRAGTLDAANLCWSEGMADWLPLAQVEPFGSSVPFQRVAPPPVPTTPHVSVRKRTRESGGSSGVATGLAIAGLALAIPSLMFSIIPLLGALAVYPAAFALLFSIIGLTVALTSKAKVGGLPIAALVVSILPVAISAFWIYSAYQAAEAIKRHVAETSKGHHSPKAPKTTGGPPTKTEPTNGVGSGKKKIRSKPKKPDIAGNDNDNGWGPRPRRVPKPSGPLVKETEPKRPGDSEDHTAPQKPTKTAGDASETNATNDFEAKLPVPDEVAQKASLAVIKEIYKDERAKVQRPDQELVLAKKILQDGIQTKDDATGRFILLRIAKDMAIQAGDLATTLSAIENTSRRYQVDALKIKAEAMAQLAKTVLSKSGQRALAASVDQMIDEAQAEDDFPTAKQLAYLAISLPANVLDATLLAKANSRIKEVDESAAAYNEAQKALKVLGEKPTDPDANLIVGKFRCYRKNAWDQGLPLLALSGDRALKALAEDEIRGAKQPPEQVALGDGWWALSEAETGLAKLRGQLRAAHWYEQALPNLSGLSKAKVEKRLGDVASAEASASGKKQNRGLSVDVGLRWLATQQQRDGSWHLDFGSNPSTLSAPTTATAMAILPFLRSGHTHLTGEHSRVVARGLAFIESQLPSKGQPEKSPEKDATMYGHAIITMALCEAFDRSQDTKWQPIAQAGVDFISYAQNPKTGGWRYKPREPGEPGDTSVTGWQLQALKIAARAKLKVSPHTFVLANRFLDSTQLAGGSEYAYTPGQKATPTMDAVGLISRANAGADLQAPPYIKGIQAIANRGPSPPSLPNIYHDYYATLLMKHAGGPEWRRWAKRMETKLLESQDTQGDNAGSWYFFKGGKDAWGDHFGRLGLTSFSLLILNELTTST